MSGRSARRAAWMPSVETHPFTGERGARGMARALRGHRPAFLTAVAASIIAEAFTLVGAGFLAYAVGTAIAQGHLDLTAVGVAAAAILARCVLIWCESWVSHELAFRLLAQFRLWLFQGFARLAPSGLANRRSGELVSAAMDDSEAMEMFYAHSVIYAATAATVPVAAVTWMIPISPAVASTTTVLLLGSLLIPWTLRRVGAAQGRALRERLARTNGRLAAMVDGLPDLLMGGQDGRIVAEAGRMDRDIARLQRLQDLRAGLETVWVGLCAGAAGLVALLLPGTPTDPARLLPLLVITLLSFGPVEALVSVTRIWGMTSSAADRVLDIIEAPDPVPDEGTVTTVPTPHDLVIDTVCYTYPGSGTPTLKDVTFTARRGETVALVGPSGAGKSTCAKMILRAADPEEGAVRIGGTDLRSMPRSTLYELVALVPQEVLLVSGTVHDNIALARPEATAEEVRAAALAAGVQGFVEQLDLGYQTPVGEEGALLSGGERARLALARALLRRPSVLLIDEGTAMLDPESELEVRDALARQAQHRSTIVIVHRLETVLWADRVVVLCDGAVVAEGTHEHLLGASDDYRRLVESQWEGLARMLTTAPGRRPPTG